MSKVEVTGSHIKRIEADGTLPVLVLDREDIRRTGATTLKELFDSAQLAVSGTSDVGGRGTYAAGSTGAGMRNLGNQATLILLNSRRVAPYPLAEYSQIYVNLDSLPLEAIERVEVLRSGGAAAYGSDAIAGVINVITRPSYQGLYARASAQKSLFSNSFGSRSASLTGGFGNLEADRYNLLVSAEAFQRDAVVWSDVLKYVNPALTARFPSFGTPSTFSYPGNVIPAGALPGCAADRLVGGLCRYDRYERFEAMPAADRFNLLASGKLKLQGGLLGFSELLFSRTETRYLSPFLPYGPALAAGSWVDVANNSIRTFNYRGLPAGHPLNPTGQDDADLRYRFVDGPSDSSGSAQQYRLLAGLRGQFGTYEWESAAGVMGGRAELKMRGSYSDSGFRQVIGNYDPGQVDPLFFQRDYRIAQPNSAEVIDRLFPAYGYTGSTRQIFVDSKMAGEVGRYEGRAINIATGFELRHERFAMTPSSILRSGDIVGQGFLESSASRIHGAAFGEVAWPALPGLELQAAGRIDKFPGFDARLSPKAALRFEPNPSLVLRATAEAGFRAPNLSESAPSTRYGFDGGISDPQRCPQAQRLAGDLRTAAGALPAGSPQSIVLVARADNLVNAECQGSVGTQARNNPDLQPETSRSVNVGLVFRPARHTGVAVDYWQITRRNEIGLRGTKELLAAEASLPPGFIERQNLGTDRSFSPAEQLAYGVTAAPLSAAISRFENAARTTTSGIDFAVNSRVETAPGPLDLQVTGTYLLTFRNWYPTLGGYGDNLVGRGLPLWRTTASASLRTGAFTNALTWTYASGQALYGDYFDTAFSPENCPTTTGWTPAECRQGSTHYINYFLAYSGVKDLTVSAHVRNLFNRRPPINLRGFQSGGGGLIPQDVSDVMGRMLRVTVEYRFK